MDKTEKKSGERAVDGRDRGNERTVMEREVWRADKVEKDERGLEKRT